MEDLLNDVIELISILIFGRTMLSPLRYAQRHARTTTAVCHRWYNAATDVWTFSQEKATMVSEKVCSVATNLNLLLIHFSFVTLSD